MPKLRLKRSLPPHKGEVQILTLLWHEQGGYDSNVHSSSLEPEFLVQLKDRPKQTAEGAGFEPAT